MSLPAITRRAGRLVRNQVFTPRVSPLDVGKIISGTYAEIPDPIEFIVSDKYLDRPNLYPRQATFLKIIFLRDDMFCADEQTEILTRRGWRPYWEVVEGEDVMTLSDQGHAEWAPAERINVFPVQDEPLVLMEGEGHSSLTTPNHRWLVEHLYRRKSGWVRDTQFRETRQLSALDRIACAAPVGNLPSEPIWDDALVELVAWYWTEGTAIVGNRGGIKIGQSKRVNPQYVDRIRACLLSLFGPASDFLTSTVDPAWREDPAAGDMVVFRLNSAASEDLRWIAPDAEKVVREDFLCSLTQSQLEIYIETSMAADGSVGSEGTQTISQRSRARLDSMQMACSLAGIRTTMRSRRTRGSGRYAGREFWHLTLLERRRYFQPKNRTGNGTHFTTQEVRHTGHVWCPTTKNGTWLARRNGTVYYTGNTQFDLDVIGEWEQTFLSTGYEGINPGIHERIRINKEQGRKWFRETQSVWGRRGSKGYVGGLSGAYVLWHYMHRPGGPQQYYGIDRDKRLTGIVFAGKKEQARDNQWRDLVNAIVGGPCFSEFISRSQTERLTIKCPNDWLREMRQDRLGVVSEDDTASFEIVPAPSTTMAARGPTSFMQFYDEQAHVINSTSNADAEAVYSSAVPALDQFKKDGFIYAPSSPWTRQGQFFANWELAIEMNEDGSPAYPERLMLQLPSWGPYQDWEDAQRIPLRPPKKTIIEMSVEVKKRKMVNGKRRTVVVTETKPVEKSIPGPTLKPLKGAIQAYDDDMRQLQRANPETFKVERLSRWADVMDAYLNPDKVEQIFHPWNGQMLFIKRSGILSETYSAHGDPATSNKRFGWGVAHRVWVPKLDEDGKDTGDGMFHVVFDRISCWEPADYPDHVLDYEDGVMPDIWEDVRSFLPDDVSFDQFNVPSTIGWLRKKLAKEQLPKQVQVHEVNRTRPVNWKHYEIFKSAINMGLVHAPMFLHERDDQDEWKINYASSEVENELKFLVEKNGAVNPPDSGPVQTKDISDAMCECVVQLIGMQMASLLGMELDIIGLRGGAPMGTDPGRHTRTTNEVGDRLGALAAGRKNTGGMSPSRGVGRGMRRR